MHGKRGISPLLIVALLVVIILLLIAGLIFLMTPSGTSTKLSLQARAIEGKVSDVFMLQVDAIGFSGMADLSVEFFDRRSEPAKVFQKKLSSGKQVISIPVQDLGPGIYTIEIILAKNQKQVKRNAVVNIVKDGARQESDECSICNDYDVCTQDICKAEECIHAPITPCCGNGDCETAESAESCPDDCKEAPIPKEEITNTVIEKAVESSDSPQNAIALCKSLPVNSDVDDCLLEASKANQNHAFCRQMISRNAQDNCLVDFVIKNEQFDLCDKIQDRWLKSSCYSYKNVKS